MDDVMNNISENIVKEIQQADVKNIVFETTEVFTPEQRMLIDCVRRLKNPFRMINVKDVMKDLNVCETVAYRIFRRSDFPSVNIGKNKQIMLIAYLVWKMNRRV